MRFQVRLILKEQGLHLPELALGAGRLGNLCGEFGMRMDLPEREVAEHEAHVLGIARPENADCAIGLLTGRTLEVAIFEKRDGRMQRALHVIGRPDGRREERLRRIGHGEPRQLEQLGGTGCKRPEYAHAGNTACAPKKLAGEAPAGAADAAP